MPNNLGINLAKIKDIIAVMKIPIILLRVKLNIPNDNFCSALTVLGIIPISDYSFGFASFSFEFELLLLFAIGAAVVDEELLLGASA